jgi:cytidyltransferase-like protein
MHTTVLVTGGFDPLHSGHISYLQAARNLGDRLVVGVNSDAWLARKKGRCFMPLAERISIIENLRMVDHVMSFDDSDGSACAAISGTLSQYSQNRIIFANGGDRNQHNIPEISIQHDRLEFRFGVGGHDKKNSSSWILEEWKAPKTQRPWGYYRVLHENSSVKVKELTVDPGAALSMQRHQDRAEFWLVDSGTATVYTIDPASTDVDLIGEYQRHQYLHISTCQWHQLANEEESPLRIIEIQYGQRCDEDDIERQE